MEKYLIEQEKYGSTAGDVCGYCGITLTGDDKESRDFCKWCLDNFLEDTEKSID